MVRDSVSMFTNKLKEDGDYDEVISERESFLCLMQIEQYLLLENDFVQLQK